MSEEKKPLKLFNEYYSIDIKDPTKIKNASANDIITTLLEYRVKSHLIKDPKNRTPENLNWLTNLQTQRYIAQKDLIKWIRLVIGGELPNQSTISKNLRKLKKQHLRISGCKYRLAEKEDDGYRLEPQNEFHKNEFSRLKHKYSLYFLKDECIKLTSLLPNDIKDEFGTIFIFKIKEEKAVEFANAVLNTYSDKDFFEVSVVDDTVTFTLSPKSDHFPKISRQLNKFFD